MNRQDRDRVVRITTVALHRAMAGDIADAARYLSRLSGSPESLGLAVQSLADTYIGQVHPEHVYGQPIAIAWTNMGESGSGDIEAADDVRPSLRWAGRIIAARAADDQAGFVALFNSQGAAFGAGMMALVDIVATSLANVAELRTKAASLMRHDDAS